MQQSADPVLVPAPVAEKERITSIDVLRGFAVLGILIMNIQAFSMIEAAYINPTAYGNLTGANFWVWTLSHIFADQKFISIFSMLFGAGVVLMSGKAEAMGESSTSLPRLRRLHYKRMMWLIIFGVLHAYLLWYADILFTYGVCGLIVYLFRKKSPRALFIVGFVLLSVSSVISMFTGILMQSWPEDAIHEMEKDWQPEQEAISEENNAYQGGWLDQMQFRAPAAFFFQTFLLLFTLGWKASGLMLFGMALFKTGVFSAQRSSRFYRGMIAVALLIGIPLIVFGIRENFANDWNIRYSFFYGSQFNYWASIFVALGWVGVVMLLCRSGWAVFLTRCLSAVGRMAFSNYILQTLICTTIFYGHGFGLFGEVERTGQIAIVFAIWILQLVVSPLWLRSFSFGPLEWLWRSLAYGRIQH